MAKSKGVKSPPKRETAWRPPAATATTMTTTSALVANPNIGYELRVLLHDFRHTTKDATSQSRVSSTTDPLYISTPYLSSHEVARIKGAIVDTWKPVYDPEDSNDCDAEIPREVAERSVQDTIESCMARFFEKRRASGDSRPCEPHDMAPHYEAVFGIARAESSWRKAS